MKARELIRLLERHGWRVVRISGSHHHFAKEGERNIVTVPAHALGRDVPIGLLHSVLKAAGIKEQQ